MASSREDNQFSTPQARWAALTRRTPSSHFAFFYGVKSTRIYCRPTCAARLARRANVVFFDTEDQAIRNGYRSCKRCRPEDPSYVGEGEDLVIRVMGLLRDRRGEPPMRRGLKELAGALEVSPSYLCRVFKKRMNMPDFGQI